MTTTVLAYFPSPAQGVWYLGPVPIRAYALCIIAGIIAALVIGDRRWVARGGERGVIYDIALWAVPFGLIGGRLYHLITDWRTYFGEGGAGPAAALRIWEGGLGIWGAVALGGVGAWIACRRRGIPLPAFGDAVAPGIVLAQAIGRLGNYFNQELYGRETTVPWGMEIFYRRDPSGMVDVHSLDGVSTGQVAAVVHPTFLYEMLWNLAVFVLLIWVDRRYRIGHGRLFALYVAAYCVGRFWVELLRDDTATQIAGIRINVFTATFVFIGAVVYILLAPKGREDPATLRGKSAVESDEESPAEEFVEELVAAAKASGIVAAATVAGEHEPDDAAAVGDSRAPGESAAEEADFVAAVEAEEMEVEAELEDELAEAVDEALVAEAEAGAESEPETPAEDSGPVVIDSGAPEADTVVVCESAPDGEEQASEAEAFEPDVVDDDVVDDVVVGGPVDDDAVVDDAVVDDAVDDSAAADGVGADLAEETAGEPAREKTPGFGATMRRLLWGVRSGD
ncbi:MAG: prolipoprotein diacylglyceryl transferase [Mycobacterium sp.]|nr:prolipoprotein diacylglyceryl transferase [Mycobacterium sp.]